MGSKSGSWAIFGAKIAQEAGKAPPKGRGLESPLMPLARFGQKVVIFNSVLGSHFGIVFAKLRVPFLSRFLVDFRADLDPIWAPKTEQEEPQEEPKSSQDEVAVENAAKSKMYVSCRRELTFWVLSLEVAQDEAQPRPRTPFCRPRTFKKEGQQLDPKK